MGPISFTLALSESILRRKTIYYYLIWPEKARFLKDILFDPGERFEQVAVRYMRQYLEDGAMPPADIAPAIMNMADDFIAGRQVALRSGDYFAIQNHLKRGGEKSS